MSTRLGLARTRRVVVAWGVLVRADEVADESFGEVDPTVDTAGLQTIQPCPGRTLEHEQNVLHGNALVAVRYVDSRGVVN